MIVIFPNVTIPDNLKYGDLITLYRTNHLVGNGELMGIAANGVMVKLDKDAGNAFSNLQGKGIPYEFEIRERTKDIINHE